MTVNIAEIATRGSHAVQFYESEEFLSSVVADFLANGLNAGEPVVAIATPQHRQAFATRLRANGVDVDNVLFLDAHETLSRFMAGAMPDGELFRASVGAVIAKLSGERGTPVCAYGEMVDVLWRAGNAEAAIRLEELWNELRARYPFTLLCAYPMGNFYKDSERDLFESMCRTHARVIPTEALPSSGESDERLRELARLQQRAVQLEAEIERRRQLERDLQDFVDHASIGMHWVGPDGTILWANDAEVALLGYTREEYIGRPISHFHADRAVIDDVLVRLEAGEVLSEYEARLRAKDGSIRHVAISSNVFFENGRFIHTRCFTRDITDRKLLEQSQRAAAESNALLLDVTTVLHQSLDVTARLREVAEVLVPRFADGWAVDLLGEDGKRTRASAAGMVDAPSHADPREAHLTPMRIVAPMKLNEHLLGAMTFISSRPRYDDADLRLACEIAHRAAIAIENARLYRLAQDANRTKDEFLATLSHELRTPLTAILGWAKMLTLGGLDAETSRTAYSTIERSARTQASLIDDLLDLSKVVTGKLKLQTDLVDVGSVVQNAVQTVQLAAEAKGISLEVSGAGKRAVVAGDATRLQQIVWNLLSNAIKFSEAGECVSVAVEHSDGRVRIVVRDRGRGIAPEFLPHVFEAFRQADGASTRAHGGLGLGLAIVKYLSEAHGGSVSATSDGLRQGATFTVTLPLALRHAGQLDAPADENLVDLNGVTILLVDDDDDTRNVVAAALRRCGADVESAESARCARTMLESRTPDFVVTDIAMPLEDGLSLMRDLRARPQPLHVVALSALAPPASADGGFRAWVRKPVDPLEFARVIAGLR